MRRNTPKSVEWQRKKRTALARVGKRGKVRKQEWAEAKAAHLAKQPWCEFWERVKWSDRHSADFPAEHRGPLDVHHVIPRGMGGGKDYGVYATLCRAHHQWVEDHREAGRELGLLMRRPSTDAA